MNFRSFTSRTLAAAALATLAFASAPASACYGYQCNNNPPPAPTPTPTNFTFQIGTGVAFQGEGFGSWAGNDGGVDIVKEGFGLTESSFTLGGDMCGGIDCAAGSFTASGSAGELVKVNGWATGNNARILNGGSAATLLQVNVQRTNVPVPAAP